MVKIDEAGINDYCIYCKRKCKQIKIAKMVYCPLKDAPLEKKQKEAKKALKKGDKK